MDIALLSNITALDVIAVVALAVAVYFGYRGYGMLSDASRFQAVVRMVEAAEQMRTLRDGGERLRFVLDTIKKTWPHLTETEAIVLVEAAVYRLNQAALNQKQKDAALNLRTKPNANANQQ